MPSLSKRNRLAKNCMPTKEKMYMNNSNKTAKLETSCNVLTIVSKIIRKSLHDRANLNTRNKRNVRNADKADSPDSLLPVINRGGANASSAHEATTTTASKVLKPSFTYCFTPNPNNLTIISMENNTVKMKLMISNVNSAVMSMG